MAFRFVPTSYSGSHNASSAPQVWRPPSTDLLVGELAVNLADGTLFLQPTSGTAIQFAPLDATGLLLASQLPVSGVTVGTYTKLVVDVKGRVTTGSTIASTDVSTALGYVPVKTVNGNAADANGNINVTSTNAATNGGTLGGISTTPVTIDTGSFITAKYLVQIVSVSNGNQISELTLIQDGASSVLLSQFGTIYTSASQTPLVTFAATCSYGVVTLTATATLSSITVSFTRTYFF